jgi:signal peptide peptidase SppA
MSFESLKEAAAGLLARLPVERFRNPPPVVGVIRLEGVIGRGGPGRPSVTLAAYEQAIGQLFRKGRLASVAVVVNSPGGSPVQSALIAKRIRDLAAEKEVPVVSFCEDVAASGGYWLACAGDEIYADASSIVGSIGVISAGFGFADLIERYGIERRVHSTGPRKGMLDPFREEKADDVDRLRELHADIFETFRAHVRERRGDRLLAADETLFSGDIWTGRQAVEVGLVDGIAEMRSEMRRRFGDKVRFRRAAVKRGLLSRLRGGVRVTIEPSDLVAALDEWAHWKRFGL